MKNLLILICAVLIIATPGFASEYFVATSGHDSCNGLGSSTGTVNPCAWGTLTKVNNSSFTTGDIINLRRGDTFTDNFINKAVTGITFQAYTDLLSPSTVPPVIDFAGMYAVLAKDGQKFNGLWFKKGQFYSWNSGTSTVMVNNCIFSDSNVNSHGVVDWEAGDLYIYNSLFIDMKLPAVFTSRNVYLYNSMLLGAGLTYSLQVVGQGNITYSHNLIWGHDWNMGVRSADCVGNCTDDGTNSNSWVDSFGISTTSLDPKFVSYAYPKPKMAWGHDDSGNIQHLFDVLDANPGLTKATFNMYVNKQHNDRLVIHWRYRKYLAG
jgi:hypothetical protein